MAPFSLGIKEPISGSVQQPVPGKVTFLDLDLALSNVHLYILKQFLKNGITLYRLLYYHHRLTDPLF